MFSPYDGMHTGCLSPSTILEAEHTRSRLITG